MADSRKRHLQLFVMVVAAISLTAAAFATGTGILPSSMNAVNDPAMVFQSEASTVNTSGNLLQIHLGDLPNGDDLAATLWMKATRPSTR